jgi:hypothetical protein
MLNQIEKSDEQMSKYNEFEEAGNELEELSMEGYFGDDIKELTSRSNDLTLNEYLFLSVKLWIDDKKIYGKNEVKEFISLFLELYDSASKINPVEVVSVLTAFWQGSKENPEAETMSSYSEFTRIFTETKTMFKNSKGKQLKLHEKKSMGANVINTYSKGVEMIGKVLNSCLALAEISNKNQYDLFKISKLTIYQKIERFNKVTNDKYSRLTSLINRQIRNSDAHLSITYKPDLNKFAYKSTVKGKVETQFIGMDEVIVKLLPSVGWIIQAFIYSNILLHFFHADKQMYLQLATEIEKA